MWRENGLLNIVIVKLVASAVVCVSLPGAPPRGGGGGVGLPLGNLGGGVLPSSPNPDPVSDHKMSFFTPVFRPVL